MTYSPFESDSAVVVTVSVVVVTVIGASVVDVTVVMAGAPGRTYVL